jgi:hypothetical protein
MLRVRDEIMSTPNRVELDTALAEAETGEAGQVLKMARQHMRPRAAFAEQLEARLAQATRTQPRWHGLRAGWRTPLLARAGILAGATALLLVVIVGWMLSRPATPASAQEVLQRAAAVRLAPNQSAHYRYQAQVMNGGGGTGTADVWVQADASGAIVRNGITLTMFGNDGAPQSILRLLIVGGFAQQYDYSLRDNTLRIMTGTVDEVISNGLNFFDGSSVAAYLNKIAQGNV